MLSAAADVKTSVLWSKGLIKKGRWTIPFKKFSRQKAQYLMNLDVLLLFFFQARVSVYEKAIYSALSGNLRGMLPVCKSWLDYVWAYFRVLVDRKVEDEIRLKTTVNRSLAVLPGEYWEKK